MIHETNAGSARDVQTINNRIAFIEGWMSEKAEAEYFAAELVELVSTKAVNVDRDILGFYDVSSFPV